MSTRAKTSVIMMSVAILIVLALSTVAITFITTSAVALYAGNQSSVAKNLNTTIGNATSGGSTTNSISK